MSDTGIGARRKEDQDVLPYWHWEMGVAEGGGERPQGEGKADGGRCEDIRRRKKGKSTAGKDFRHGGMNLEKGQR